MIPKALIENYFWTILYLRPKYHSFALSFNRFYGKFMANFIVTVTIGSSLHLPSKRMLSLSFKTKSFTKSEREREKKTKSFMLSWSLIKNVSSVLVWKRIPGKKLLATLKSQTKNMNVNSHKKCTLKELLKSNLASNTYIYKSTKWMKATETKSSNCDKTRKKNKKNEHGDWRWWWNDIPTQWSSTTSRPQGSDKRNLL